MPYETLNDLPNEVKDKLPQGAQREFLAAFKSATSDGMSEDSASRVAWNSVKMAYEQGADGSWHHKPEGGAGRTNVGTMPQS